MTRLLQLFLLACTLLLLCPGSAWAEQFRFDPAPVTLTFPDGWIAATSSDFQPQITFEQARERDELDALLDSSFFIGQFATLMGDDRLVRCNINLIPSFGKLEPDAIASLLSSFERMLTEEDPLVSIVESDVTSVGEYSAVWVISQTGRKDSRQECFQAWVWDANYTTRLVFGYDPQDSATLRPQAQQVLASFTGGEPPRGRSPFQKAVAVLSLGAGLVLLIVLVPRFMRRKSPPATASAAAALFLAVSLLPTATAHAENAANLTAVLPDTILLEDNEGWDLVFDAGLDRFFPPDLRPWVLLASLDIEEEHPNEDYFHLYAYPILRPNATALSIAEFELAFLEFNKFSQVKQTVEQKEYTDTAMVFYSLRLIIQEGDATLDVLALARPYDFGWMVIEVFGPTRFIDANYRHFVRTITTLKVQDEQALLALSDPATEPYDLKPWGYGFALLFAIAAVITAMRKRKAGGAAASSAMVLVALLFVAAGPPDTSFLPACWKPVETAPPPLLESYMAAAPESSDISAFRNADGALLFAVELWDRPGAFPAHSTGKVAWHKITRKDTLGGTFTWNDQDGAVLLLDKGPARTLCLVLIGSDPLAAVIATAADFASQRKPTSPVFVFSLLVGFILLVTLYYAWRQRVRPSSGQEAVGK